MLSEIIAPLVESGIVTKVVEVMTELVTKIGPYIKKVFEFLFSKVPEFLDKVEPIIDVAEMVFMAKNMNVSSEILGQKASKFAGKAEDFDNFKDYVNTVENTDIDVKAKENLTPEEYHLYKTLGMAIKIANLAKEINAEIKPGFLEGMVNLGADKDPKLAKEMWNLVKEENKQPDLKSYLKNELNSKEDIEAYEFLKEALEKTGEEKTVTELLRGAE